MQGNPVVWFEIYVQDMTRAKRFYETVFGVRLEKLENPAQQPGMEMWAFPMNSEAGGASGALVRMPGLPSGGNGTLVYFACSDLTDELGRVVAAGGRVQQARMSIGQYGFIGLAVDTEGNMIGLHSMQ